VARDGKSSSQGKVQRLLVGSLTGLFAYSMLETMLSPALPKIQEALELPTELVAWTFTGQLLAAAIALPLAAGAIQIYGAARVLRAILLFLALGICGSAMATTLWQLALAQALQGAGMGLIPVSISLAASTRWATRADGVLVAVATASTGTGLILGGVLASIVSYRWLFAVAFVSVALAAAVVGSARLTSEEGVPGTRGVRLDWSGAALFSITIVSLLLVLTSFAPERPLGPMPIASAAVAGIAGLFWWRQARQSKAPLLDARLLLAARFRTAVCVSFVTGAGAFGSFVLVPLSVEQTMATSVPSLSPSILTGFLLLPFALLGTLSATMFLMFERRLGLRCSVALGVLLIGLGLGLLGTVPSRIDIAIVALGMAGAGIGLTMTGLLEVARRSFDGADVPAAGALLFLTKTIGSCVGAQVSATVLAAYGFAAAFITLAVIAFAAAAAALCIDTTKSASIAHARRTF
jgi:MFS family permease